MGGIYPNVTVKDERRWPDGTRTWTEVTTTPGVTEERYVVASAPVVKRTDCFCCTCGDREGSDFACRNHGYYAQRPCERHGMPGQPWEGTDEMPESVQAELARLRASRLEIERDGS
jgi:hypothetical protein